MTLAEESSGFHCTMKPTRIGLRLPGRDDGGFLRLWVGESQSGQWMWLLSHQFGCHAASGLEGFDYEPVDVGSLPELREDLPIRDQAKAIWEEHQASTS
ncbi:hypothetical protein D9M68_806280 [compost metagenome]